MIFSVQLAIDAGVDWRDYHREPAATRAFNGVRWRPPERLANAPVRCWPAEIIMPRPFDASSTADEVLAGVDLTGKRVLVTGVSAGLGAETARSLVAHGAHVVGAARDLNKAARAAAQAHAAARKGGGFEFIELDLASLASVRRCADALLAKAVPLDLIIGNAGVMASPFGRTTDGFETQFGTNHLGHFALTVALHQALAAAENGARVVSVSSNAHHFSAVEFSDIDFENRDYDPWLAYGQSKTANILHAVEITRRWGHEGILANALNPGAIPTRLQRHVGGMSTPEELRKTVEQGAATSVFLAASPLVEGVGGRYFEDCQEAVVTSEPAPFGGGVNPYAIDPDNAQKLWDVSLSMLDNT